MNPRLQDRKASLSLDHQSAEIIALFKATKNRVHCPFIGPNRYFYESRSSLLANKETIAKLTKLKKLFGPLHPFRLLKVLKTSYAGFCYCGLSRLDSLCHLKLAFNYDKLYDSVFKVEKKRAAID